MQFSSVLFYLIIHTKPMAYGHCMAPDDKWFTKIVDLENYKKKAKRKTTQFSKLILSCKHLK